jgi:hypothetical protein
MSPKFMPAYSSLIGDKESLFESYSGQNILLGAQAPFHVQFF